MNYKENDSNNVKNNSLYTQELDRPEEYMKLPKDTIITRTNQRIVDDIYDLLEIFNAVATKYDIRYVTVFGTALGTARHNGLIPWDDDADVAIHKKDMFTLQSLKSIFMSEYNCFLDDTWCGGLQIYKTTSIKRSADGKGLPLLDIFIVDDSDPDYMNFFCQQHSKCQDFYLTRRIKKDIWDTPFKLYTFGHLKLYGFAQIKEYLKEMYGNEWENIAYRDFDHDTQKELPRIKTQIVTRDCAKHSSFQIFN